MNFSPFFNATPVIQIHMITAIAAFFLGAAVLWRRKGGLGHRVAGYMWVALMLITSISAFFIHEIRMWGEWSPIHLLAVSVPLALIFAIHAARKRKLNLHRRIMQRTYLGGMIIAGGFTFLPGRLNYRILFSDGGGSAVHILWLMPLFLGLAGFVLLSRRNAVH